MSSPATAASIAACTVVNGLAIEPSPPLGALPSTCSSAARADDAIVETKVVMHPTNVMVGAGLQPVFRIVMTAHARSAGEARHGLRSTVGSRWSTMKDEVSRG